MEPRSDKQGDSFSKNSPESLAVANIYDPSQKSTVIDSYTDTLTFHADVLDSLGISRNKVIQEIQSCEKIANCIESLSMEVSKAAGTKEDKGDKSKRLATKAKSGFTSPLISRSAVGLPVWTQRKTWTKRCSLGAARPKDRPSSGEGPCRGGGPKRFSWPV